MIKKLRKKIFWSIEGSALGVLFLILIVYNVVHYMNNENEEWQMLSTVVQSACESLSMEQGFSGPSGREPFGDRGMGKAHRKGGRKTAEIVNGLVSGDIALVELDTEGNVQHMSGFLEEYSDEERDRFMEQIFSEDKEEGRKGKFKYMQQKGEGYRVAAVLDAGYVNMDTLMMAFISLLGFILAGGIFGLIARKISMVIAKPVEETITNQRQFIADASHELKTPVSVMLANISVLEKEIGQNRWMDYIKEEGKRMSDLTNNLLLLSRIDYETEASDKTDGFFSYNLSDACLEAALPFESIAYEQGIRYEMNVSENVYAEGVPEDVKQIVCILLDNALKHVENNGRVILSVGEETEHRGLRSMKKSVIHVQNTGEGIREESLPYIFNRFYKADTSRQYEENSFGLGLAIAKSLTERNHGTIRVISGSGMTEFTVVLPAAEGAKVKV